jgi:hypothetical protein
VLLSAVLEVLDYRGRAPEFLSAAPAIYLKTAMVVASFTLPLASPAAAAAYGAAVVAAMVALGLRRVPAYIAASLPVVYLTLLASAAVLGGDIASAARFTTFVAATAPTLAFVFATTKPSTARRVPALYLLLVVLSSVLREVVDIATSYRARGSAGLGYWMRVVVAAVAVGLSRAQTLSDSLRSRGIEVVE